MALHHQELHYYIQQIRMSDKDLEAGALKLKQEGNAFFKVKDYEKAIEKYSSAITLCPKISILYSNRSRCFRELRNFERSYADAQKAVELDEKNIKAYFLMGETLVEIAVNSKDRKMIEMAIEKLKKSLRLCPSQGKSEFQERFVDEIYKAKKKLWHLTSEESAQRKKALRSYLVNIVENDMTISEDEKDAMNDNITHLIEKKFNYKEKVARALICPITKVIMKDPVCNQHGNSYSKRVYIEEVQRNNKKDPISGKPITTNILYSNINLKKAIEAFLEKNPWAYDEVQL